MPRSVQVVLSIALFSLAQVAQSDTFGVSHSCSKPHKPYQFEDEWDLQRFKDEVEDYRRCLEDFVEEQNQEIKNHQDAIDEAVDEWDRFVNYELN